MNSAAMEDNFAQTRHQQLALTRAFEIASGEASAGAVWTFGKASGLARYWIPWPARETGIQVFATKAVATFRVQTMPLSTVDMIMGASQVMCATRP